MIKKFDKNKSYIFSRERYIETSGIILTDEKEWYDGINEVEIEVTSENTGKCWDYLVVPEWCEENPNPKVKMELNRKEKDILIKALEYLDNNNYFIEEEDTKTITKLLKKLK